MEAKQLARNTDPPSSHEAASGAVKSGKVGNHSRIVLRALALHPGSTYKQLATHIIGLDKHEVARRLPGLRNKRKVAHCENCDYSPENCFSRCRFAQYHKSKNQTKMLRWWVI